MFGYVQINKAKLSKEEYDRFRSCYCGLCHVLKERYGNVGRITLSYDMTFLSLLLSALYEPEEFSTNRRCPCHPLKLHEESVSPLTAYAADMNLILAYYKSLDDWHDEKKLHALLFSHALKGRITEIEAKYPEKCAVIRESILQLSTLEKESTWDIDKMTSFVGKCYGTVYAYQCDLWSTPLAQMGDALGRFIYLMDAYEDLPEDKKKKLPNPLLSISEQPDYEAFMEQLLTMEMDKCASAFELLPIVKDVHLLRNVLYSGVWGRYAVNKKKLDKEKETK